ncbi:hypothetical protein EHM92_00635 [bacterium]|nr:MAG: hypothetical protein EHM92_00635 [bacterium]
MIIRLFLAAAIAILVCSCKDAGTEPSPAPASPDTTHTWPPYIVRKPNIYLYPLQKQWTSVEITFPGGGKVLESDPPYGAGWLVEADPNGLINGKFSYLYYEARVNNLFQFSSGWVVRQDTLADFFSHVLQSAGFNDKETGDFLEYWPPRLTSSPFYLVYPQQKEDLEKMIALRVTPAPDVQLRLTFVIRAAVTENAVLNSPRLIKAVRHGFTLTEWGVVIE